MKRTLLAGLAFVALSLVAPAHAAFVSTDWQVQGDAKATLDSDTGIEWLDLTETFNLSFAQMNDRLATDLAGWRYATYTEVIDLMARFFDSDPLTWSNQFLPTADDSFAEREAWRSLFGVNNAAGTGVSMGIVRYDEANTNAWSLFGPYHYGSDVTYIAPTTGGYYYSAQNGYSGYFIVSDGGNTLSSILDPSLNANNPNAPVTGPVANVSAPAGLALLSLAGVMGWRRRRQG